MSIFGLMGLVLVSWVWLGLVFLGLAGLAVRLGGWRGQWYRPGSAWPWLGGAVAVLVLQAVHLVVPLGGGGVFLGLSVLGGVGLLLGRGGWLRSVWCWVCANRWWSLGLVGLSVWAANRSIGPPVHFDTGAYHATSVRWAAEYAILPGLGNLHDLLGFNNALHLI